MNLNIKNIVYDFFNWFFTDFNHKLKLMLVTILVLIILRKLMFNPKFKKYITYLNDITSLIKIKYIIYIFSFIILLIYATVCILIVLSMPTCFILLIESMRYFPLLHSLVPFVLIHGTIWIVLTISDTLVNKNQPQCCQLSLDIYSFSDNIWFLITFFATLFIV